MSALLQSSRNDEYVGNTLRQKEKQKSEYKKDESLLEKLGTIGRRKPKKEQPGNTDEDEAVKVDLEGTDAIDSSGYPLL